jgi:hypothetical protein
VVLVQMWLASKSALRLVCSAWQKWLDPFVARSTSPTLLAPDRVLMASTGTSVLVLALQLPHPPPHATSKHVITAVANVRA